MDGGAWWATVNGVAKSWTQLSNFTLKVPQGLALCPFPAGVPLPQKHNGPRLLQCDPGEGGQHQVVRAGGGVRWWAGPLGTGLLGPCFVVSFSSFDGTRMDHTFCSKPTGGDRQAWSFPAAPFGSFQVLNLYPVSWGEGIGMGHRWAGASCSCSMISQAQVFPVHGTRI